MTIENIAKKLVSWKKILLSQKKISLAVLFLFIAGVLLFVHPVLAQTTAAPASAATTFTGSSIFNAFLTGISWLMMKVAQTCLQLLMFVLSFVIQIAAYNGYLDSTAVNTGWILIRDLTNMVFVVALLAIAFGSILGIEHYEWKHMLFKLVSAAILVNFSRIICGILIDISQVVMMTFINGIAATASGNLIRAFSLERIQSFANGTVGAQIDPVTVFITAMAAVFVSVTILVVMCVMLAMLIARMIVLWVLIVLSPVAFVLGILHQTEHYASEWWGEFGKNVITGPVLVFFIWLTLVTVGSGVAGQEIGQGSPGINKPQEINVGIADVLTGERLVNFAIAIGMLLVGLRITQHLGGIGAEWSGSAVSMGKKAAMAVSGVALARSAVQKGAELGKEAVKMPFVEAGKYTAARAKTLYAEKWANPRADKIGKMVKDANTKDKNGNYVNPWLKRVGANTYATLTSKLYRDKIIGSREKEAEATAGLAPHLLSTSSTDAGIAKRKAEEKLAFYEHTGHDIDSEKEAKEKERQMRAMNIIKDAGEGPLNEAQLEALKKENFTEDEAREMLKREERAIDSKIIGGTVGDIVSTHNQEMQSEREAGLMRKVSWGGETHKIDGKNREQSISKFIDDMHDKGVPVGLQDEYLKRFEAGQEVEIGGKTVKLEDHEKATLDEAKEKLVAAANNNEISPKQLKNYTANLEFQQKELERAHLSKVSEQMGKEVGSQRRLVEAKTEDHLMGHDKSYTQREGRINQFSHEMKQIEEKTAAEKEINLLKQIKDLLSKDPAKEMQIKLSSLVGQRDLEKMNVEKQRLKIMAEAARRGNQISFANQLEQQANSLSFNKTQDGFKAADFNANERANLAAQIASQQKALHKKAENSPLNDDDQKTLENLTKQKVALTAVNWSKTAYDAQQDMRKSLEALGWNMEWTAENQLQRFLSAQLGRLVGESPEEISQAQNDLKQSLGGDDEYNAAFRQLGVAGKNQISLLNRDAIIFDESMDPKSGRTIYKMSERTGEQQAKFINSTIPGWVGAGDVNAANAKQAMGTRNATYEKDGKITQSGEHITNISENEMKINASLFAGANSNSIDRNKGGVLGDINNAQISKDNLVKQLQFFAEGVADGGAFDALIKKFGTVIEKTGITASEIEEIKKIVKKSGGNKKGEGDFQEGGGI